jgi:Domain of unknown function (DUF1929)
VHKPHFLCLLLLCFVVSCGSVPDVAEPDFVPPKDITIEQGDVGPAATNGFNGINGGANASSLGYFAAPTEWPLVAVHASTLPNGKVLTWASSDPEGAAVNDYLVNKTSTAVDLWDPRTDAHTRVDNATNGQELFGSGHSLSADGELIVTGGNNGVAPGSSYSGANTAFAYNAFKNAWTRLPNMGGGRWYPTTTTLANGEIITMGGNTTAGDAINVIPEVFKRDNTWRTLGNADITNRAAGQYPWNHVAPNGQLFTSGPATGMAYLDTSGAGNWNGSIPRDSLYRGYGTSVLYDLGKLLVLGGNTSSALTVDLNNTAQVSPTASMSTSRTFMNATLLPNGNVFVNGGDSDGDFNSEANSVYSSETWNPNTGQWTLGASASVPRNYHSTALLLPDGRVLTTGSRLCGTGCALNHLNAELYYPPYLFKKDGSGELAARPNISGYSSAAPLSANGRFVLYTPGQASTISKVTLIRMGSTTHAFNMDQRFLSVNFKRYGSDWIMAESPNNPNIAPPGYYMMFAVNAAGVPSVGRIIRFRLP